MLPISSLSSCVKYDIDLKWGKRNLTCLICIVKRNYILDTLGRGGLNSTYSGNDRKWFSLSSRIFSFDNLQIKISKWKKLINNLPGRDTKSRLEKIAIFFKILILDNRVCFFKTLEILRDFWHPLILSAPIFHFLILLIICHIILMMLVWIIWY